MRATPLDVWAACKCGGIPMGEWQLARLKETLVRAEKSPFYRERLIPVERLEELARLPLMDSGDLVREDARLLCAPPDEIARIVTLRTSGTTGPPKRLRFTGVDLRLTEDFFAGGLPTVASPGERVAVMMPCAAPDGVGDLIRRGLARTSAVAVPHGPLIRLEDAARMLTRTGARAAVGFPVQLLALTRYLAANGLQTNLRAVLLSADNIPGVLVRELESRGLAVYQHFGMTETGYGCAIDCDAHAGLHLREPDLLAEIVNPRSGAPLPDGQVGELVITTLTRRGMPLIRYRTGDLARIRPGACPCGSALRRLETLWGRVDGGVSLDGGALTMPMLDEALFALPQLMDFRVTAARGRLVVELACFAELEPLSPDRVREALHGIPAIGGTPGMELEITIREYADYHPLHAGKRVLYRQPDAAPA